MKWLVALIYAFVLAAPTAVILYSFSPTVVLELPPSGLSLSWYANLFDQPRLLTAIASSTLVAAGATTLALCVGVPAAFALSRSKRSITGTFLLSPLVVPGLILALGLLMSLRFVWPALIGSIWPLVLAHVLITVPWVIRTVAASLELFDRSQEEAARGLGASRLEAFLLVTLPAIRPGIVTGALFAFIVSFGNFALSLFFASGRVTTLPVAIFEYIDQFQDPTVAAASSLVIFGTTVAVIVASRMRDMELP